MKKIQLTIPDPCHENWDQMTPQQKGRFCGSCQKTVVDFTNMSDREIAEFFKKPTSSLCGHFHQDQLDRDISVPRKRIPWIKYFFRFSLPALLISCKASAQGKVAVRGETVCLNPSKSNKNDSTKNDGEREFSGVVRDIDGRSIPFAWVRVIGTNLKTEADIRGEFKIRALPNSIIEFSAVGFEATMIKTSSSSSNLLEITMNRAMGGLVVVTSVRKKSKKKNNIPLVKKIVDTAFQNFSVYPNPAHNNSYLKIDCGQLANGEYVLSVIDMSGEVLQTEEIIIDDKKKVIEFYLEGAKAGSYIIHMFNRKSTASFSEKIIVQ